MHISSPAAFVLAAFSITSALASDVRLLAFPNTVIGTWAPAKDSCGGSTRATLNISQKQHSSADATCQVIWITVTASRDGPVYSARSNCAKKGGKKEPPSYLVVSPKPDGKLLVRMPGSGPDDEMVDYQKCL